MRRPGIVALVVVAVAVLAWVGWPDPAKDNAATSRDVATGAAASLPTAEATPAPTPEPVDDSEDGDYEIPSLAQPVEAVWDEPTRESARAAATSALVAFARPGLSQQQWWDGVKDHLTPQAQYVYETVDARVIIAVRVAGPAQVVDESTSLLTRVLVPTDGGVYEVVLTRVNAASPWLAEKILSPVDEP